MKILLVAVLTVVASSSVVAEGPRIADADRENAAGEYAECAAYYALVFHAMQNSGELETASNYKRLEEQALILSLTLASQLDGRDIDMAGRVTRSRVDLYDKQMRDDAGNRNENISILINQHHADCLSLSQHAEGDFNDVLREKDN